MSSHLDFMLLDISEQKVRSGTPGIGVCKTKVVIVDVARKGTVGNIFADWLRQRRFLSIFSGAGSLCLSLF